MDITSWNAGAHPRSRGEHRTIPTGGSFPPGSSPLARGTPPEFFNASHPRGLIPARAGNTGDGHCYPNRARAHPRSRGEHSLTRRRVLGLLGSSPLARGTQCESGVGVNEGGSSPLARGTLTDEHGLSRYCGLIPARAGNTREKGIKNVPPWAHPRSRGEHAAKLRAPAIMSGSSPLARGTPDFSAHILKAGGLIPARAGNT